MAEFQNRQDPVRQDRGSELRPTARIIDVCNGDTLIIDSVEYDVVGVTNTGLVHLRDANGDKETWGEYSLLNHIRNADHVEVIHG